VGKLGGLAMPDNGFGWNAADRPPTSDEFVAAGPLLRAHDRVLRCRPLHVRVELPVDRMSAPYGVLWNGLNKIAARFSRCERNAMFFDTATGSTASRQRGASEMSAVGRRRREMGAAGCWSFRSTGPPWCGLST
jgi:hypothetical protein